MDDIIRSKDIHRTTLIQQLRVAARMSKTERFWLLFNESVNLSWKPLDSEKEVINVFGQDLNHINGISATKSQVKNISTFPAHTLHPNKSNTETQEIVMATVIPTVNAQGYKIYQYTGAFENALRELRRESSSEWVWVVKPGYDYSSFDFSWRPDPWNSYGCHSFDNKAYLMHITCSLDVPMYYKDYQFRNAILKFDIAEMNLDEALDNHVNDFDYWLYDSSLTNYDHFDWEKEQDRLNWNDGMIVFKTIDDKVTRTYYVHASFDLKDLSKNVKSVEKTVDLTRKDPIIHVVDTLNNGNGTTYTNYLDLANEFAFQSASTRFWMVANHVDYSKIDFYWLPEIWDEQYQHVYATGSQMRGDVFLFNSRNFRNAKQLDEIGEFKFLDSMVKSKIGYPVTTEMTDDLPSMVMNTNILSPWGFARNSNSDLVSGWKWPIPCYWYGPRIETWGDSEDVILYHSSVKKAITSELTEFPTIIRNRRIASTAKPLDVIFLSNGEHHAENNFNWLKSICPRAKHVTNIQGRRESYQAMAEASDTDWFFAVFAKLMVYSKFDWHWQPDRLQAPKHYIFKAENCLNGLYYGHMAMVAANKNIVLKQEQYGLDFTMQGRHVVVDMNSGGAFFNGSPEETWRTAFRECVKLTHYLSKNKNDVETFERLNTWLTYASGTHEMWCIQGAIDGHEYAKRNEGDMTALIRSREWDWLHEYFTSRYEQPQP